MSVAACLSPAATTGSLATGLWTSGVRLWYSEPPAAEISITRIGCVASPPRTATDRHFNRFQARKAVFPGALFALCLAAVSVSLLSE